MLVLHLLHCQVSLRASATRHCHLIPLEECQHLFQVSVLEKAVSSEQQASLLLYTDWDLLIDFGYYKAQGQGA